MYILMLDNWKLSRMKQTRMYVCTLKNIYSSRDLDALLYKLELNMHWKNAGLYTLATKD